MPDVLSRAFGLAQVVVEVREGDITTADVEAVTNAANSRLFMGAGVAGAIKRARHIALLPYTGKSLEEDR